LLTLTPLELIDRIAALVPPPRTHRHRYYGALAPNSPASEPPEPVPSKRSPAHYLWAALIARIYEVFPLLCPICGGQMRIIAFITHSADIRQILDHLGVQSEPPNIAPARGPPLWEADAQWGEGGQALVGWDLQAQPATDYEVNQRISW
jgi:Putative transposase